MIGTVHEYALFIREHHLDTFGHVNNARYLDILEEARWELITRNGFGLDRVVRDRLGPTILEVTLKFQRELRNRQPIVVKSWMVSYPRKVGQMVQQIRDADDGLCCEAQLAFGLFDLDARKLVAPTPAWLHAIGLNEDDLRA
jgi:thioesterase-3